MLDLVADVVGIEVGIREDGLDGAQLTDGATVKPSPADEPLPAVPVAVAPQPVAPAITPGERGERRGPPAGGSQGRRQGAEGGGQRGGGARGPGQANAQPPTPAAPVTTQ